MPDFQETRRLFAGLFPKAELTPELADVYRSTLEKLHQPTLQDALRRLVTQTSNWTPRIQQILDCYQAIRAERAAPARKSNPINDAEELERSVLEDHMAMYHELTEQPIGYLRSLDIYFNVDRNGPLESWSRLAVGMTWAAHRQNLPV